MIFYRAGVSVPNLPGTLQDVDGVKGEQQDSDMLAKRAVLDSIPRFLCHGSLYLFLCTHSDSLWLDSVLNVQDIRGQVSFQATHTREARLQGFIVEVNLIWEFLRLSYEHTFSLYDINNPTTLPTFTVLRSP